MYRGHPDIYKVLIILVGDSLTIFFSVPCVCAVNADTLLKWCQQQTKHYKHVKITDMSASWKDGLAFCALIHHFRPDLL